MADQETPRCPTNATAVGQCVLYQGHEGGHRWPRLAERGLNVDFVPDLQSVLNWLLKGAQAQGIVIDEDWSIAWLRKELVAHRGADE